MDIEVKVDLDIHAFSGSGITNYESGLTNCILHNNNGQLEVTQRPAINISEDATTILALNNRGRGIYYWEVNNKLYIVHDNDLYETTQDSTRIAENTGAFSTGTERCTMLETIGVERLVILDSENNKGWVMTAAKLLDQIASNFPSTIVHGGIILDGYLIVMDEDGIIYNSAVDDPTTFPATSFVEAERENDKGVYLGKHHNHAVAFGTRTIEFLYDAKNTSGSVLNRREDIMHNTGCADGLGVWENGDVTYFVGSGTTGQIAVYKLENFNITLISNDSMNSYLTQGITQESLRVVLNGVSMMGHDTLIMTIYTLTGAAPGEIDPKISFCYDSVTGQWGFIDTPLNSLTTFPLMAFTKRTGGQNAVEAARPGEGIFYNGSIFSVNDKLIPIDTLLGDDGVYEDGIYESDIYVSAASDVGSNIPITIRTGIVDGEIRGYKFQNSETVMMESTEESQTLTVSHSDETSNDFIVSGTIDTSEDRKETYAGGRFVKRGYQLEYAGSEQIFIEKFQADLEAGD